jgi:hypothetical protein
VDVVKTSTGYTAVFGKNSSVSGSGGLLITAYSINSPDAKNISRFDDSLI